MQYILTEGTAASAVLKQAGILSSSEFTLCPNGVLAEKKEIVNQNRQNKEAIADQAIHLEVETSVHTLDGY